MRSPGIRVNGRGYPSPPLANPLTTQPAAPAATGNPG